MFTRIKGKFETYKMKDYTTQSFFIKKITFKNYYLRLSLFVLQKYSITTICLV